MLNKLLKLCLLVSLPAALLTATAYAEQLDIYCPQTVTIQCSSLSIYSDDCKVIKTSSTTMTGLGVGDFNIGVKVPVQMSFTGTYYAGGGMAVCDYASAHFSADVGAIGGFYTPDRKHGSWHLNIVPVCPSSSSAHSKTMTDTRICPYHFTNQQTKK